MSDCKVTFCHWQTEQHISTPVDEELKTQLPRPLSPPPPPPLCYISFQSGRSFTLFAGLKRENGRSPITVHLHSLYLRPCLLPLPRRRKLHRFRQIRKPLDEVGERHYSICLGRSRPVWGVCAAAAVSSALHLFGGDKIASPDSCPLITAAGARQDCVPPPPTATNVATPS